MLCLITYDLKLERDYSKLYEAIKNLGVCWRHLRSVWIVKSTYDPKTIANYLRKFIDEDDKLFVVDITGKEKDGWLDKQAWDWFTTNNV